MRTRTNVQQPKNCGDDAAHERSGECCHRKNHSGVPRKETVFRTTDVGFLDTGGLLAVHPIFFILHFCDGTLSTIDTFNVRSSIIFMTFPHSDFERHSLDNAARRAVESHGQPEYVLNPEDRETRKQEHTGIELTGVELEYLKKMTSDRIEAIEAKIPVLEESIEEGKASNMENAREELEGLRKELDFLQNNLAEKLFGE